MAILVVAAIFAGTVAADNVYLKNGQVYTECVAKNLPNGSVEITLKGGKLVLPQSEIAYVEKEKVNEEELKPGQPELSPILEAWEAAKGAQQSGGQAKQEEAAQQVKQLVELFKDPDATVRNQAVDTLVTMGSKATPYLLPFLDSDDMATRLHVSAVLAQSKPKDAVRQLLQALYAGSPPAGRAPYYMTDYLTNINTALMAATGQNFYYLPNIDTQFEAVDKYVEWYKANVMTLPPQIGDPQKKEGEEDKAYQDRVAKARELKLARKSFVAPGAVQQPEETPQVPPQEVQPSTTTAVPSEGK
jgi:hypothetical protein